MKIVFSICCGVVLSLFAARAGAQVDSSAIMRLYCGQLNEGCEMEVNCQEGSNIVYSSATAGFDSSIRFGDIGRLGIAPWQSLNLSIDFGDSEITNLTITNGEDIQVNGTDAGWADLTLVFPFIPFHYKNGVIEITPGKYLCSTSFGAFCKFGLDNVCSGSCSKTDTIMDSVFFEITPATDVVESTLESSESFRAIGMNTQEAFAYSPQPFDRSLVLCDILGRTISTILIPSGQTLNQSQNLPPGCYFARLGNHVAKFVVPPR